MPRGALTAASAAYLVLSCNAMSPMPDPAGVAKMVGDAFLASSKPPADVDGKTTCPEVNGYKCGMMNWGYGGALIMDGMYQLPFISGAQLLRMPWSAGLPCLTLLTATQAAAQFNLGNH
eukprot:gene7517-7031_t